MHSDETLWIDQIRTNNDSFALSKLIEKYRPMIDNMCNKYYIVGFDHSDWYQEAFFICYQTCKIFDGSTGSKFGSFFKLRFRNRAIDLIRRENANKRKVNTLAKLLEESDQDQLTTPSHRRLVELSEHIEQVTSTMGQDELVAMQFIFGKITLKKACDDINCDEKRFQEIVFSCKKKISGYNS